MYYLNGHCISFANILKNIFLNSTTMYNSDDHVITKINNNFYDVTGEIKEDLDKYYESDMQDLFYIEIAFGIKDEIEKIVEEELINLGRIYLNNLEINKENINKSKFI